MPEVNPTAQPTPTADAKEIAEGKLLAVLSYVIPFVCLAPLTQKDNAYSLYHAKQSLGPWVVFLAAQVVQHMLFRMFVLSFSFGLLQLIGLVVMLVGLALLALAVIGVINAANGQMKPLPVIGPYVADMLKGVQKNA